MDSLGGPGEWGAFLAGVSVTVGVGAWLWRTFKPNGKHGAKEANHEYLEEQFRLTRHDVRGEIGRQFNGHEMGDRDRFDALERRFDRVESKIDNIILHRKQE